MLGHDRACPSQDELIRLAAGDLSVARAAQVRAHVRGCAICSSVADEWRRSIEEARGASPPDTPQWQGFSSKLAAEEASWQGRQIAVRRWRSSIAAIAATMLLALAWYSQTEVTLDAEEVVGRAAAFDGGRVAHTVIVRRIPSLTPTSGADVAPPGGRRVSGTDEAEGDLSLRLQAYGFQADRALSVVPFQRWRQSITVVHERVARSGGDRVVVVTTAATGAIKQAEIIVRTESFEPISQRWEFTDGVAFTLAIEPETRAPVPSRAAELPSTAPEVVRGRQATPDFEALELDLRTDLRHFGVPVGSAVHVSRVGATVRADGIVTSAATATRVQERLRRPHLGGDIRVARPPSDPPTTSTNMERWLNTAFADPELRRTFVSRLWSSVGALDDEARGFVSLAERYDVRASDTLSSEARTRLDALIDAQHRAVGARYSELEQHLAGLVGTVSRPLFSEHAPSDWREEAPAILANVEQLTGNLRDLVTRDGADDFAAASAAVVRPTLESLARHLAPTR